MITEIGTRIIKQKIHHCDSSAKNQVKFQQDCDCLRGVAVSSLSDSNIHVLEPSVKINLDTSAIALLFLRQMLLHDSRATTGSKFFVLQQDNAPSHRVRHSSAAGWRDGIFYLSALHCGRLTHRTSTRLTTPYGVCFGSESVAPRARTSTNWNDASSASIGCFESRGYWTCLCSCWRQPLWAHANKDDVMWHEAMPVVFVAVQLIIQIYT